MQHLDVERLESRVLLAFEAVSTSVIVTEGMAAAPAIRLHLTAPPAGSIAVNISRVSGDTDLSVVDSTVFFDTNNWRADKYIRLQAIADADTSGGVATIRASASGFSPLDIQASEKDDDGAQGIELSAASLAIAEGRTTTARVRLTARPTSTITVLTVKTGGDADVEVDAHGSLNFNATDWDKWQWVSFAADSDLDSTDGAASFEVRATGLLTQTLTVSEVDAQTQSAVYDAIIDDYESLPAQGSASNAVFPLNRLGGNRGIIGSGVQFRHGFVDVTATNSGVWSSLSHLASEQLPLNLQALLPSQISPAFQYRATAVTAEILDGTGTFRMELKDAGNIVIWSSQTTLIGGPRSFRFALPSNLGSAQYFNWLMVGGVGGNVRVAEVGLEVTGPKLGHLEGFLWPYASLLANFDSNSGLVRDSSGVAAGQFDGINGTGALAAATALAEKLGVVSTASAQTIVSSIASRLISLQTTAAHNGVLAHFVRWNGSAFVPTSGTEYSSIDSAIAFVWTLQASQALGLPTAALEQAIDNINWPALVLPDGTVSHGYHNNGTRIGQPGWDYFGTESLFTALAFAAAQGSLPTIPNINVSNPRTWNGSGFIDEMLWTTMTPVGKDSYGPDWDIYRTTASTRQIDHYDNGPTPVFGASAGEVPVLSQVPIGGGTYQAYGVGVNSYDGSNIYLAPVETPHYAGMIWSLYPDDSKRMFDHLTQAGLISPLNVVESMVVQTWSGQPEYLWNSQKGSWNLGLWALGAGRGLLAGVEVNPLFKAARDNAFLRGGLDLLTATPRNLNLGSATAILDTARSFDSISIATGGRLIIREGGLNSLLTSSIAMSAGATLDLEDNDFILDYTGASPLNAIQSLINTARNGGAWDGTGITSTSARDADAHNTTLGVMEASDYTAITGLATFSDQPIDSTAVLVKYTYYGDTDFSGAVDFDDYVRTDAGYNFGLSDWLNGDFDGSGSVDFDDYVLIDLGFNTQEGVL